MEIQLKQLKKLKGQKINRIEKGLADDAFSTKATGLEKTGAFATGAGLGGIAEGMAVANVKKLVHLEI